MSQIDFHRVPTRDHRPRTTSNAARNPSRFGGALSRRHRIILSLIVGLITFFYGPINSFTQFGPIPAQASGIATKFNILDPRSLVVPDTPRNAVGSPASNSGTSPQPGKLVHPAPMSMTAGSVTLDPGKPTQFIGSDGRFEVDVPNGAVTPADVAAAGGQLNLSVRQVAPASGGTGGGSGRD